MEVVKTAEVILLERTKYKIKTLTLTFKMFNSCILVQQIHQPTPQNWAKTVILTGNFRCAAITQYNWCVQNLLVLVLVLYVPVKGIRHRLIFCSLGFGIHL